MVTITFQPQKCPNAEPDVIQYGTQAPALGAFNQALLFQTAMVHFNPPRRAGKLFAFRFSHLGKARCPVLRCAVCGTNPKYFDLTKSFEPPVRPVAPAKARFRDRLQLAVPNSKLAILFQSSQKMPIQRATQFQVFNRSIPTIKTNQWRIETTLRLPPAAFRQNGHFWFCHPGLCQTRDNQSEHSEHRQSRAR